MSIRRTASTTVWKYLLHLTQNFYLFTPLNLKWPPVSSVQCFCLTSSRRSLGITWERQQKPSFCCGLFKSLMVWQSRRPHSEAACYIPNKSTFIVSDSRWQLWSTVLFSALVSGVLRSVGTAQHSSGLSQLLKSDRNKTTTLGSENLDFQTVLCGRLVEDF